MRRAPCCGRTTGWCAAGVLIRDALSSGSTAREPRPGVEDGLTAEISAGVVWRLLTGRPGCGTAVVGDQNTRAGQPHRQPPRRRRRHRRTRHPPSLLRWATPVALPHAHGIDDPHSTTNRTNKKPSKTFVKTCYGQTRTGAGRARVGDLNVSPAPGVTCWFGSVKAQQAASRSHAATRHARYHKLRRAGPAHTLRPYGIMQTTTSVRALRTVASSRPRWFWSIL